MKSWYFINYQVDLQDARMVRIVCMAIATAIRFFEIVARIVWMVKMVINQEGQYGLYG